MGRPALETLRASSSCFFCVRRDKRATWRSALSGSDGLSPVIFGIWPPTARARLGARFTAVKDWRSNVTI